jgi:aryl-alcohol dehydrogenase-like predicted oxidoreductase
VHPICDLQIEYSLVSRGPERAIFPVLEELRIGVTAYGVLSRGLLSGSRLGGKGDMRAHMPRFAADNLARNQKLVEALGRLAAELGATPSQLAIAWVLAKGARIVPVMGARTRAQLDESLGALRFTLSPDQIARLEEAVPASEVAGRATPSSRCSTSTARSEGHAASSSSSSVTAMRWVKPATPANAPARM